jgi:hypothetical protein
MESLKKINTLTIKLNEPVPPGSNILETMANGTKIVEYPIKFTSIKDSQGNILSWERRPKEDFI